MAREGEVVVVGFVEEVDLVEEEVVHEVVVVVGVVLGAGEDIDSLIFVYDFVGYFTRRWWLISCAGCNLLNVIFDNLIAAAICLYLNNGKGTHPLSYTFTCYINIYISVQIANLFEMYESKQ